MGQFNSQELPKHKIPMFGDFEAGRTSILYKVLLGLDIQAIPTIGFNVEKVRDVSCNMELRDIGGASRIKVLWHHYTQDADGFIFVVHSRVIKSNYADEIREDFERVLNFEGTEKLPILVWANHCDEIEAATAREVQDALHITSSLLERRQILVMSSSAVTGQGIREGLRWLHRAIHLAKEGVVSPDLCRPLYKPTPVAYLAVQEPPNSHCCGDRVSTRR